MRDGKGLFGASSVDDGVGGGVVDSVQGYFNPADFALLAYLQALLPPVQGDDTSTNANQSGNTATASTTASGMQAMSINNPAARDLDIGTATVERIALQQMEVLGRFHSSPYLEPTMQVRKNITTTPISASTATPTTTTTTTSEERSV
jgi:hypothetical protein